MHALLLCVIPFFITACASSPPSPKLTLWDHPLVDRIWDVQQQKFVDRAVLLQQVLHAEYLLLGERHDNQVHHRHQTWIVRQLHQARRQASVAFEMIDDRQGALLAKHRITSVDQMIGILRQFGTHWEYEQRYKALFAEVLMAGYPVIPANLNRERLMQVVQEGEAKLPPAYQQMLAQAHLTAGQMNSLRQEIRTSHCNMLDAQATDRMVLAQRVRDALMAHSLMKSGAPVKVLIAGAGHVRKDRGAPRYLAAHGRTARVMTIGFTEVAAGESDITHYTGRWGTDRLPFDFAWFTPAVERHDLCAGIRARHKLRG